MSSYTYRVRDREGKVITGETEAIDARDLRRKLDERGYFIIEYAEKKSPDNPLRDLFKSRAKVNLPDISVFSWQLYTLLDAGLPLVDSLRTIVNQTRNEKMKQVVDDLSHRVEEGASFSDALKQYPNVFSKLYIQMIQAGEVGGVLDEMLRRLAIFHEKQAEVNSKIKSALAYPALLLIISLGVGVFLVTYVLPRFVFVFEGIGAEIPVPTRILLDLSAFLRSYWYVFIIAAVGIGAAVKFYLRTDKGAYRFDELKLTFPIVGELVKKTTASRFAETLSILVSSGIPILTAFDVVTETIGNRVIEDVLKDASVMIGEGKSIAQPLEESDVFPEMVVNMISVGEETGALDSMLRKVSEFYDREVDNAIQVFTKLIEPVMIVFMAVMIGFIAISIFLPMADLMASLKA